MAKSIKLKNDIYWDSKSIAHNQKLLSDILYPIGSIYMSVNSTSPATLFGGTWKQIEGRFLYCTTTSKTTGGDTITGKATGNTGDTTLTIANIPSHRHYGIYGELTAGSTEGADRMYYHNNSLTSSGVAEGTKSSIRGINTDYDLFTGLTGNGKSHSHTLNSHTHTQSLPPYFTVYCWYRTA